MDLWPEQWGRVVGSSGDIWPQLVTGPCSVEDAVSTPELGDRQCYIPVHPTGGHCIRRVSLAAQLFTQ
jgi:hypothetical protein